MIGQSHTLPETVGHEPPSSPDPPGSLAAPGAHSWLESEADDQFWQWSKHTVLKAHGTLEGHLAQFSAFSWTE